MSLNTVVRARIDDAIKKEAAAVLAEMGLTLSDAYRLLLRRIAKDKALPFEPFEPGPATIAALSEPMADRPRFESTEALFAHLNAGD